MAGVLKCVLPTLHLLLPQRPRLASFALLPAILSLVVSAGTVSAQYCTRDQCDECNLCQCSQTCCHELPELWLINTRCAPRCKHLDNGFDCLIYKRYDRKCCRWIQESAATFLAQESSMPTLFYSHGNSLNHKNAMKSCWKVYCKMRCCPGSKRLVFWSWPAERVYKTQGLRVREMVEKNLRIKYVYAEYQGYYMAKLVNQMSLSQRVMMSGHSYGGITTAAALHYLGGGCLRGLTLDGAAAVERPNLRAAVISGAFDNDMLIPGHRYGQAFVAGEKIFVTRNINDSTLKKWPKTSWTGRRAIGVTGVNANCLGVYRDKLCQITMTVDVGKSHYIKPHLKSVRFVSALCCLSFPECDNCSIAASDVTDAVSNEQTEATAAAATIRIWETEGLTEMDLTSLFDTTATNDEYMNFIADAQLAEPQHAELQPELQLIPPAKKLGTAKQSGPAETSATLATASPLEVAARLQPSRQQPNRNQPSRHQPNRIQPSRHQLPRTQPLAAPTPLSPARRHPSGEFQSQQPRSQQPQAQQPQPQKPQPQPFRSQQAQSQHSILSEPIPPTPSATEPQASQNSRPFQLWVRCGLCLGLVLTGKIYIFFGKRVPAS